MDSTDLTESFETGLFESEDGRQFVRCEFNPEEPVLIDVSGNQWTATYAGQFIELDWSKLKLSEVVEVPLRRVILRRLKTNAPTYLRQIQAALEELTKSAARQGVSIKCGFGKLSASNWLGIWDNLGSHARSLIRSIYQELAEMDSAGADFAMGKELARWKARDEVQVLRVVTEWNAESGSFTSSEWELVRKALKQDDGAENDRDCATRIFGWVLNETLKRSIQILSMKRDALWSAPSEREFFLRVPKVKGQAGEGASSWQITEALAASIRAYCQRPSIRELQIRFDRLIVMPRADGEDAKWMTRGQVDVVVAKARLKTWIERQGVTSPRTSRLIHLTPYRIRHTGATSMALQGVPRDQIQEVLEHDSPASADAYIQAAASELMPALERATDRGVGTIFSELRNVYFFKGTVVDNVQRRPIHIPVAEDGIAAPAVVGSCGKAGVCTKHPFWACYNGCPRFLAWRDGPHRRSLEYVESELARWSRAEGGKERTKLHKDFDQVGAAIREVIGQIEQSSDAGTRDERG